MKDHRFPSNFEVKVGIHGVGVFVNSDVKKGKILFKMRGKIKDHPTRTSVQVGRDQHIEDTLAGHINHNCTPNAKVNRKMRYFVSLRDIKKGEEITFDYNVNEDCMASPFKCECCGNTITGKKSPVPLKKSELLTTS